MIQYSGLVFNSAFFAFFAAGAAYMLFFFFQKRFWSGSGFALTVAGQILLTAVIASRMFVSGTFSVFGLYESLVFFVWSLTALFILFSRKTGENVNSILVLPIAVLILGAAKLAGNAVKPLPPALQSPWFGAHVTLCFLAYGCFVLSFCFSVLYIWQENEVKSRKIDAFFFRLPSLGLLDKTGYQSAVAGFVFLTMGIVSGSLWAHAAWGSFWSWDPKETWALILWLVYLVYMHGRLVRGWKGRKSAYIAIAGFAVMLFTYLGVSFLLPGLHSYL